MKSAKYNLMLKIYFGMLFMAIIAIITIFPKYKAENPQLKYTNLEIQTLLTDGDKSNYIAFDKASNNLPETAYDLGDISFWGTNFGTAGFTDAEYNYLKKANIKTIRYDLSWNTFQPRSEIKYDLYNLRKNIKKLRCEGIEEEIEKWQCNNNNNKHKFNIIATINDFSGAYNGYHTSLVPANKSIDYDSSDKMAGEKVTFTDTENIQQLDYGSEEYPLILSPALQPEMPIVVMPEIDGQVPTTLIENEIDTIYEKVNGQVTVDKPFVYNTINKPILPGANEEVTIMVDEGNNNSYEIQEEWTKVENIPIDNPEWCKNNKLPNETIDQCILNRKVYMSERAGMFRFPNHTIDPVPGFEIFKYCEQKDNCKVEIKAKYTYIGDANNKPYAHNKDYYIDWKNGTITRKVGNISGGIDSLDLNQWTARNNWQSTFENGKLKVSFNETDDEKGNYIYQTLQDTTPDVQNDEDFVLALNINDVPSGDYNAGIMIMQDDNNWFRFTANRWYTGPNQTVPTYRPQLTQTINGTTTTLGNALEYGDGCSLPTWVVIKRQNGIWYPYIGSENDPLVIDGTCNIKNNDKYIEIGNGPNTRRDNDSKTIVQDQSINFSGNPKTLKIGISITKGDNISIDQFKVIKPDMLKNVRVFYNYLNTDAIRNYVQGLVLEFKDYIKYWETWNEPDGRAFETLADMELTAVISREMSKAIKEKDPEAMVTTPGMSDSGAKQIKTVLDVAGNNIFDRVAWHPYYQQCIAPDVKTKKQINAEPTNWLDGVNNDYNNNIYTGSTSEFPRLLSHFGEISTMGGAYDCSGNSNETAGFFNTNSVLQADFGTRLIIEAGKINFLESFQWWPFVDEKEIGDYEFTPEGPNGYHRGLLYKYPQGYINKIQRTKIPNSDNEYEVNLWLTDKSAKPSPDSVGKYFKEGEKIIVSEIPDTTIIDDDTIEKAENLNGSWTLLNKDLDNNQVKLTFKMKFLTTDQNDYSISHNKTKFDIGNVQTSPEKPMYYAMSNLANNKGIIMDLVSYDSNNNPTPSEKNYTLDKIKLFVKDLANLKNVKIFSSLTNTSSESTPFKTAATYYYKDGDQYKQNYSQPQLIVDIKTKTKNQENEWIPNPDLKSEKWMVTYNGGDKFTVSGSISENQGIASIGQPFTSNNQLLTFTLPTYPPRGYQVGEYFTFETFVGDDYSEIGDWTRSNESGEGTVEINLPDNRKVRYLYIQFEKNGSDPVLISEIEAYDQGQNNIAQEKLYRADGFSKDKPTTDTSNPTNPVSPTNPITPTPTLTTTILNMVSFPKIDSSQSFAFLDHMVKKEDGKSRLFKYDPAISKNDKYLKYNIDTDERFGNPDPGKGYWMLTESNDVINSLQYDRSSQANIITEIKQGWNLLGNPFDSSLSLSQLRFITNDREYTFDEAVNTGLVDNYGWSYDQNYSSSFYNINSNIWENSNYRFVSNESKWDDRYVTGRVNTVEPWHGFWFYVKNDTITQVKYIQ